MNHLTQQRNPTLAWALAVLDWSPERLARVLNRELVALAHHRRVSRNSPAQWRDQNMVPRPPLPTITAHVLSQALDRPLSVHELWQGRAADPELIVPADFGLDQPWNPAGTVEILHTVRSDRMLRRQFLTISGMSFFGPASDWSRSSPTVLGPSPYGSHVSHTLIEAIESNMANLRHLDDTGAGELVQRRTEDELYFVIDLLKGARYDGRTATRLYGCAANLAQLAGWVSYDLGQEARAQRFYLTALHAAHTANDQQLGAYILSCMAGQAKRRGRPREALLLLDAAKRGSAGRATPSVQMMLCFKEAHAHALAGDELACAVALNQAEKLVDRLRPEDDPSWAYWLTDNPESCLSITIGACLADLGPQQLRRAEDHLGAGIARYTNAYTRDKAVDLPTLAEVQRRRGELEAACATATEALNLSVDSGTTRGLAALAAFRKRLSTEARTPAIRDFLDLSHGKVSAA